jgi:hypothetical protein
MHERKIGPVQIAILHAFLCEITKESRLLANQGDIFYLFMVMVIDAYAQ